MMEVVFWWQVRVVFETVENERVRENCLFLDAFAHTIFDEYPVQSIVVFGKLCQVLGVFDRVAQLLNLNSLEILR